MEKLELGDNLLAVFPLNRYNKGGLKNLKMKQNLWKGVKELRKLHMITFILLVIGGLNWLLVGISGKDLFVMLGMGMRSPLPMIVYLLVGLSAINEIIVHKSICIECSKGMAKPSGTPGM